MFKLALGTFTRKVTVHVPEGDATKEQTFRVTYKVMSATAARELETSGEIVDWLHDAVIKIDDLVDEKGAALNWDDDVAAQFWDLPYVFIPVLYTYRDTIEEARAKN